MMLFAILHDESAVRTLVAIKSVVIKQLIVPFRVSCLLSNIFLQLKIKIVFYKLKKIYTEYD